MRVIGKSRAGRDEADGSGIVRKLIARPGNALPANELAHRVAEVFTKQFREVHRMYAGNAGNFRESRCLGGVGTQIFRVSTFSAAESDWVARSLLAETAESKASPVTSGI